jgi:ATP-dependent Clp protease adaptor protein ClpS
MDDADYRGRIRLARVDGGHRGVYRAHRGGGPRIGSREREEPPVAFAPSRVAASAAGPGDPPERKPPPAAPRRDEETEVIDRPKAQTPRLYKVVFHNDDYTTMEFVILVLRMFFHKSDAEATHIMLTVHRKGSGVAGVYTRDVAETKVQEVTRYARDNGMPLLVTAEPE